MPTTATRSHQHWVSTYPLRRYFPVSLYYKSIDMRLINLSAPQEDHSQGESLAKGSPNRLTRPAQVVDDFADERNWYDYNSATSRIPNKPIGHFTQLVWEETRGVGCVFRHDCPEKVQTQ